MLARIQILWSRREAACEGDAGLDDRRRDRYDYFQCPDGAGAGGSGSHGPAQAGAPSEDLNGQETLGIT